MRNICCVIVTNPDRSLFYLQKKDDKHPYPELRLKYTPFGGAAERRESYKEAMDRELREELEEDAANLIIENLKEIFEIVIETPHGDHNFILFESVLKNSDLLRIAKMLIKEGEGGDIIKREDLNSIDMSYALKVIMEKYLE